MAQLRVLSGFCLRGGLDVAAGTLLTIGVDIDTITAARLQYAGFLGPPIVVDPGTDPATVFNAEGNAIIQLEAVEGFCIGVADVVKGSLISVTEDRADILQDQGRA